jgi:hypothetical protein
MLVQKFLSFSEPVHVQNVLMPWYVSFSLIACYDIVAVQVEKFSSVSAGGGKGCWIVSCKKLKFKNFTLYSGCLHRLRNNADKTSLEHRSAVGRMMQEWIWMSGVVSFQCSPGCTSIPNESSPPPLVSITLRKLFLASSTLICGDELQHSYTLLSSDL